MAAERTENVGKIIKNLLEDLARKSKFFTLFLFGSRVFILARIKKGGSNV